MGARAVQQLENMGMGRCDKKKRGYADEGQEEGDRETEEQMRASRGDGEEAGLPEYADRLLLCLPRHSAAAAAAAPSSAAPSPAAAAAIPSS